jgi:hypothetical protein
MHSKQHIYEQCASFAAKSPDMLWQTHPSQFSMAMHPAACTYASPELPMASFSVANGSLADF